MEESTQLGDVSIFNDGSEFKKEIRPVSTILMQDVIVFCFVFFFWGGVFSPSTLSPEWKIGSFFKPIKKHKKRRRVGPEDGLSERMVCARSCLPKNLASYHSLIVEAHGVSAALF